MNHPFLACVYIVLFCGLVQGCSSKGGAAIDYSIAPHLPTPNAGSYGRKKGSSKDQVIATMTNDSQFDAFLSGAAAGLALDAIQGKGGLMGWEVREALWQAGYLYPISSVAGWTTNHGQAPPETLFQWVQSTAEDEDVFGWGCSASDFPEAVAQPPSLSSSQLAPDTTNRPSACMSNNSTNTQDIQHGQLDPNIRAKMREFV